MNTQVEPIVSLLGSSNIDCEPDVDLSTVTYLRTGGIAKAVAYPKNTEELVRLFEILNRTNTKYKIVGNTSNLLFHDDEDYTLLISTMKMNGLVYDADTAVFTAQAGAMMPDLSREALYQGVTGFEGLEGIPGTVGGGLFMNAGAYGYELKDVLVSAEVVHPDAEVEILTTAQFALAHRTSILRKERAGSIVTKLHFKGRPGNADQIFSRMELYHAKRHKYQDFMYPNLGSIFSGSPYRCLARRDKFYMILSSLYFFFGYKFKIFRNESPINRRWLNHWAVRRFPVLNYAVQPFSDKTLNCLVNRGQGTKEMVRFINDLEALICGEVAIENEIVEPF